MKKIKNLFIIFTIFQIFSCKTIYTDYTKNVTIKISHYSLDSCKYFCHYLNFEIINNNNVGIYLPNIWKYYSVINEKNNDISGIIEDFEGKNYQDNEHLLTKNEIYHNDSLKNNTYFSLKKSNLYKKNLQKLIDNDFEIYHKEVLKNNIQYTYDEIIEIKELFIEYKYGSLIYIEPKKSINIIKGINYLYSNYIINENYIDIDSHGTLIKLSDTIENPFNHLYKNYDKNRTKKVKIVFNYIAKPQIIENDSIEFPLDYFNQKSNKSMMISKVFPKKILGKYHLISELKSKDTLTINIK